MQLVGPDGFGHNLFGQTKGNFNSRQIGHNSLKIRQNIAFLRDQKSIISKMLSFTPLKILKFTFFAKKLENAPSRPLKW